jgi:hypothetical protein
MSALTNSPQCYGGGMISDRKPLPYPATLVALADCVVRTAGLLLRQQVHLPRDRVGMRLRFADDSSARVYRETVIDPGVAKDPCVLVAAFRLRAVRGWGHAAFRWESLLNTPLFVGFPGFVSKLWMADDQHGRYRGLYEWDGALRADYYACALWRVLALVCVPGSIHYVVLPGRRRADVLAVQVRREGPHPPLADPNCVVYGLLARIPASSGVPPCTPYTSRPSHLRLGSKVPSSADPQLVASPDDYDPGRWRGVCNVGATDPAGLR